MLWKRTPLVGKDRRILYELNPTFRKLAWIAAAAAAAATAVTAALTVRHEDGYLSPVITPDGQFVYFVQRSTTGLVWGLGLEFFTPPAKAHLFRDRFQLRRIKMDGSSFETLGEWPPSPLEGMTIEEYRGRVFSIANATLRFENSRLLYQVVVTIPGRPASQTWVVQGEWPWQKSVSPGTAPWVPGYASMGPSEDVLREPWEVLTAPGRESYPCAVVAYDDRTAELRVLRRNSVCGTIYPGGIRWQDVAEQSRRQNIRRIRTLRALRQKLIDNGRAGGLGEMAAILQADRSLADMGYYTKPPQIIARLVSRERAENARPLFRITEPEFRAGLFDDIEKAIAEPGEEVAKSMGSYIVHQDYDTSRRLNEFLASGGKTFYVERLGHLYELVLTEPRPAYR